MAPRTSAPSAFNRDVSEAVARQARDAGDAEARGEVGYARGDTASFVAVTP